MAMVNFLADML